MSLFNQSNKAPANPAEQLTDAEKHVLDKFAALVVKWDMTAPGILLLESVKPMNYISSQLLVFAEPIVQTVFNFRDYDTFREALEKRISIEETLQRIEARDADAVKRRRAIKKWYRAEKKKWTLQQRWLGFGRPKLTLPDEIKEMPDGYSDVVGKNAKKNEEPPADGTAQ